MMWKTDKVPFARIAGAKVIKLSYALRRAIHGRGSARTIGRAGIVGTVA